MKRLTRWLGGLLWLSAVLLVPVPNGWAEEDADLFEIIIKDMDFKYENVSVTNQTVVLPAGMEMSWLNVDPLITSSGLEGLMPHFLYIKDQDGNEIAQSKILMQNNTTFNYKFTDRGIYSYGCKIHPMMKGKVLVFEVQLAAMTAEHHAAR